MKPNVMIRPVLCRNAMVLLLLCLALSVTALAMSGTPPIPDEAPVFLVGHPELSGSVLGSYEVVFAMGRSAKDEGLGLGDSIAPRALQSLTLEEATRDGKPVLRRSVRVRRAGNDKVLQYASIDMDPDTLLPIFAESEQGGTRTTLVYDWERFVVTKTSGEESSEVKLDIPMLEVGAHDVWMAALPLKEGFRARLPVVFGATGDKYWAVPRVVGSEAIDLGDGKSRMAWIVELDWWGMGAANTSDNYSPGGGANHSAGAGGKYWVLKEATGGVPRVVRIRTEVNADMESIVQLQ